MNDEFKGFFAPDLPDFGALIAITMTPKRVLLYGPCGGPASVTPLCAQMDMLVERWPDAQMAQGAAYCYGAVMAVVKDLEEALLWEKDLNEKANAHFPHDKIKAWKVGPHVGISAMALCIACQGSAPQRPDTPKDVADLGRCVHMLIMTGLDARDALEHLPEKWHGIINKMDVFTQLFAQGSLEEVHELLKVELSR